MKKLVMVLLLLGMGTLVLAAGSKTFNSSGQILDGEEWTGVYIYGDDTVVDMFGGFVDQAKMYNGSTFNLQGGSSLTLAYDTSTVNVSGGAHSVLGYDFSTINVTPGADLYTFRVADSSTAHVLGGDLIIVAGRGSGVAHVHQCDSLTSLHFEDSSVAYLYGSNLYKTETGGRFGFGYAAGLWENGTAFTVAFTDAETYAHVVLVPEPMTGLLVTIGIVYARRYRK